jgi:hypothetical protein
MDEDSCLGRGWVWNGVMYAAGVRATIGAVGGLLQVIIQSAIVLL